jgi:DNA-binding NarL/FixJ family response regulator
MATQEITRDLTTVHNASLTGSYGDVPRYVHASVNPTKIRVFSVDSRPLVQCGIATLIQNQPDMILVGQASTGGEAVERFHECTPDVILIDLQLPDMDCVTAMSSITAESPEARFIVLTDSLGDVEIHRVLAAGARGCVLKNMPANELLASIRQVRAGKKRIPPEVAALLAEHCSDTMLTTREVEVLSYVVAGNRNRDIAQQLFITVETVKVHIRHILEKLGAADRTHAVAIGLRRGIIQL